MVNRAIRELGPMSDSVPDFPLAGGIADARGILAAFALGAAAVQMGPPTCCARRPRSARCTVRVPRLWDRFAQKPRRQGRATSLPYGRAKRRALLVNFPQPN